MLLVQRSLLRPRPRSPLLLLLAPRCRLANSVHRRKVSTSLLLDQQQHQWSTSSLLRVAPLSSLCPLRPTRLSMMFTSLAEEPPFHLSTPTTTTSQRKSLSTSATATATQQQQRRRPPSAADKLKASLIHKIVDQICPDRARPPHRHVGNSTPSVARKREEEAGARRHQHLPAPAAAVFSRVANEVELDAEDVVNLFNVVASAITITPSSSASASVGASQPTAPASTDSAAAAGEREPDIFAIFTAGAADVIQRVLVALHYRRAWRHASALVLSLIHI